MPCCVKRKATVAEAHAKLEEMYDSTDDLLAGNGCPIDGSNTRVVWFSYDFVNLGYLRCEQGHALPLIRKRRRR